jgi:hypothetical protein
MLKIRTLIYSLLILMLISSCTSATPSTSTQQPTATPEPSDTLLTDTVLPAAPTVTLTSIPTTTPSTTFPVVILVIDEFSPVDNALESLVQTEKTDIIIPTPQPNGVDCIVSPDEFGKYGSSGMGNGIAGVAHGRVVYSVIWDKIFAASGNPGASLSQNNSFTSPVTSSITTTIPAWLDALDVWSFDSSYLTLVAVDTDDFNTAEISTLIQEAIDLFKHGFQLGNLTVPSVSRFVLNMSFGIVPCDPFEVSLVVSLKDYDSIINSDEDLKALREALNAQVPPISDEDKLSVLWQARPLIAKIFDHDNPEKMLGTFAKDLLKAKLEALQAKYQIINVAASGNFGVLDSGQPGYMYPFAPAIWDNVLSVSASEDGKPSNKAAYANPGEVIIDDSIPGKTLTLVYGSTFSPSNPDLTNVEGTSFSAPKLSYYSALYLLSGFSTPCIPTAGPTPTTLPPLGYSSELGRRWDNLTVDVAKMRFCTDFPYP